MMTMTNESMTSDMQTCLQACTDSHKACLETMAHYMKVAGKSADMNLMCMLRDCAEVSLMCMNLIVDGSEFMGRTATLCAEMCEKCATACEMMTDNAEMMACASVCRYCAETCKTLGRQSVAYFRRPNLVTEETLLSSSVIS
jgi:hypothetical protein